MLFSSRLAEEKGVEEAMESLIQKASNEDRDKLFPSVFIFFAEKFYGSKPYSANFKRMAGIFTSMLKKEKRTEFKDFTLAYLTFMIERRKNKSCFVDFFV